MFNFGKYCSVAANLITGNYVLLEGESFVGLVGMIIKLIYQVLLYGNHHEVKNVIL